MKGISPVVAVVLLIAIATISAVALWYWVGPMTARPVTIDYTQQKFAVAGCQASTATLQLRSESGFTLSDLTFSVVNFSTGEELCADAYTIATIASGETVQATNSSPCNMEATSAYILRSELGIPDVPFTCRR